MTVSVENGTIVFLKMVMYTLLMLMEKSPALLLCLL